MVVVSPAPLQRRREKASQMGTDSPAKQKRGQRRAQEEGQGSLECSRGGGDDTSIIGSVTIGLPRGKDKVDPYLKEGLQISSNELKTYRDQANPRQGFWRKAQKTQLYDGRRGEGFFNKGKTEGKDGLLCQHK